MAGRGFEITIDDQRLTIPELNGDSHAYLNWNWKQMGDMEEGNGAYAWWHLRKCYLRNKNQMGTMLAQQLRSFAWQTLEPETEILRFESLVNQYRVCMGKELSQLDQQAYLTDSIPTTETSLSILKENILSDNLGLDAIKDRLRKWGATHLRQSTTSTSPQQDIMAMMQNTQPPAPPLFPPQGSYPVQPPMPLMAPHM
ncbi:unnamed protein product [Vitrella brassicaformis CCMP3155]|uniref:Uncharacterized protein n=1 Tax=Vitrella brassicaformis (strain CCMP3155) TaxID=1169540 RepID=A0A0G4GR87_VITBC|nr:unnamed protein product [Vitrella brassicaformis CCMP3155]|eukprot:CEM32858.1 unnamed protein product [Vitrella brassicaformis CCMP3155]